MGSATGRRYFEDRRRAALHRSRRGCAASYREGLPHHAGGASMMRPIVTTDHGAAGTRHGRLHRFPVKPTRRADLPRRLEDVAAAGADRERMARAGGAIVDGSARTASLRTSARGTPVCGEAGRAADEVRLPDPILLLESTRCLALIDRLPRQPEISAPAGFLAASHHFTSLPWTAASCRPGHWPTLHRGMATTGMASATSPDPSTFRASQSAEVRSGGSIGSAARCRAGRR